MKHVKKMRFTVQMLCFKAFLFLLAVPSLTHAEKMNHYEPIGTQGAVVGRSTEYIKGATAERVVFYANKCPCSSEKIARTGLLVRYDDAIGTVLMCHGFMCDKYDQGCLRGIFPDGKYNLMSFDFRAHGEDCKEQFCTLGRDEAYDVIAAAEFLKNHPSTKSKPLFVYGFSMGAVAAIEAQAKDPSLFQAMVLDCPFNSTEDLIKQALEHLKVSFWGYRFEMPGKQLLQQYAFHPYIQSLVKVVLKAVSNLDTKHVVTRPYPVKPEQSVKKISAPSLFIICKNDELVSTKSFKKIFYNAASHYKKLWITNGRRHFDSYFYKPEQYSNQIRMFLEKVVEGGFDTMHQQEIQEDADENVLS